MELYDQTKEVNTLFISKPLLVVLNLVSCNNKQESLVSKGPIRIGFMGPLSGDPAVIGIQQMNSVKLALEEINSRGGVNGKKLEIVYE
ncbi:hypothetical protein LDC_2314, partial [sediment metagenome]